MNSNKTFGEAILVMGKSKWGDYSREKEEKKRKRKLEIVFTLWWRKQAQIIPNPWWCQRTDNPTVTPTPQDYPYNIVIITTLGPSSQML